MTERYIDGSNLIAGRLATYAAKQALLGDNIKIVNAQKVILTGKKEIILKKFQHRRSLGKPQKGPFFHRNPDRLLRRMIRGMVPYHQSKGKSAYQRVMCYVGVPDFFKDKKFETLSLAQLSKTKSVRYISLGELSKLIK